MVGVWESPHNRYNDHIRVCKALLLLENLVNNLLEKELGYGSVQKMKEASFDWLKNV